MPSTLKPKPLDEKAMLELTEKAKVALADAMARDDTLCYSIESYRFTRQNPESDAMRLTEHSHCQPATQFHLKRVTPPASEAAH